MIEAKNLHKQFSGKTAVDQVSLHVNTSEIFGLLGPNAAGKTTLIRLLCGILASDSGEVEINSMTIKDAKQDIGYVSQYFGQYEELTVWENLEFYARMYGVDDDQRLNDLLSRYDLSKFKHQWSGKLSGGYKRRLALACALAHDPKVLFLDEPTAGIDPVTRKLLWDDFYKLSAEGKTLFVTTHYMEEAQRCHQLAFISAGKIVATGNPDSIKNALGEVVVYSSQISYAPDLNEALNDLNGILLINQFGNELRIVVQKQFDREDLEKVITTHLKQPFTLVKTEANLEDVFIALTQN